MHRVTKPTSGQGRHSRAHPRIGSSGCGLRIWRLFPSQIDADSARRLGTGAIMATANQPKRSVKPSFGKT